MTGQRKQGCFERILSFFNKVTERKTAFLINQWQLYKEYCSFICLAFKPQLTIHVFNSLFGDGQTEAGSRFFCREIGYEYP